VLEEDEIEPSLPCGGDGKPLDASEAISGGSQRSGTHGLSLKKRGQSI
jgi:hypothetical protein